MDTWTLKQAKRDYEIGYLDSFGITRCHDMDGWMVRFNAGSRHGYLVDSRTHQPRIFLSLHSVVRTVESVGFSIHDLS
jgi:hypothetical protein